MASRKQTNKSAAARSTAKQPPRGGKRAAKAKRPIRREVGAGVCLLLGLCAALACFGIDAPGLNVLSLLFRGLIGAGLYILPFSLLMGFIILLLHDGRPVALRVTCAMLLSVTIGALVHVFTGGVTAGSDGLIPALWQAGIDWSYLPMYLVGVAAAFVSGYLAIYLLRMLMQRSRFGGFAYYCWGAGLVTLILSLVA